MKVAKLAAFFIGIIVGKKERLPIKIGSLSFENFYLVLNRINSASS